MRTYENSNKLNKLLYREILTKIILAFLNSFPRPHAHPSHTYSFSHSNSRLLDEECIYKYYHYVLPYSSFL
jgi:hypothetical protein